MDLDALRTQTTQNTLSTRRPAVPEGDYVAIIDKLGDREGGLREVNTKNGIRYILPIRWHITDLPGGNLDEAKQACGREPSDDLYVTQDVWLDLTPEGMLDEAEGRNMALGRIREAAGQNQPGVEWSLGMLEGAGPVLIKVSTRTDGETGDEYNDVKRVSALS